MITDGGNLEDPAVLKISKPTTTTSTDVFGTGMFCDASIDGGFNFVLTKPKSKVKTYSQTTIGISYFEYYSQGNGESGINITSGVSLWGLLFGIDFTYRTETVKEEEK